MSRLKPVLAISLLMAIASFVPQAQATNSATIKVMIAGSSALWQGTAIAAYGGSSTSCPPGAVKPCYHYTSDNFNLFDTRPATKLDDPNTVWIIWDSHTTGVSSAVNHSPNVWAYIKVDSVVGNRCYFAQPRCNTQIATWPASPGNKISVWGDGSSDNDPNGNTDVNHNGPTVVAAFTASAGVLVNVAATDIRPEDGLFAMCRANSSLDTTHTSAPLGLGYNTNFTEGACPGSGAVSSTLVGTDIGSAFTNTAGVTATAHTAAFNISGHDPFNTTKTIPAFTVVPAGASPIVFVTHILSTATSDPLINVTNVTDAQLQATFSGTGGCDGTNLGGNAGALDVFLREPLSGTMNTTEYNVFLYPNFSGTSQETGVDPTANGSCNGGVNNCAILNHACGSGTRQRGVGTGDVLNNLLKLDTTRDSIAYAFFSYGNVSKLADNSSFRYLTLDGVDPIFHAYVATAGQATPDPGQPTASIGEIPGAADLPSTCKGGAGHFPCDESKIWGGGSLTVGGNTHTCDPTNADTVCGALSFPNLRSGTYRAWSVLRFVSDGTALTTISGLVTAAQAYADYATPDFVPVVPITKSTTTGAIPDPGLNLLRSHYQQVDGAGTAIGNAPINADSTLAGHHGDVGGDVGGCVLHAVPGSTTANLHADDQTTGLTQASTGGSGCVVFSTH